MGQEGTQLPSGPDSGENSKMDFQGSYVWVSVTAMLWIYFGLALWAATLTAWVIFKRRWLEKETASPEEHPTGRTRSMPVRWGKSALRLPRQPLESARHSICGHAEEMDPLLPEDLNGGADEGTAIDEELSSESSGTDPGPGPVQIGFIAHPVGNALWWASASIFGGVFLLNYVIWISDAQIPCELSSHMWDERMKAFILCFSVTLFLTICMKLFVPQLKTLFIVRTQLNQASIVRVYVAIHNYEEENVQELRRDAAGRFVNRCTELFKKLTGSAVEPGWTSGFVDVKSGETCGAYFDFMCQRWVFAKSVGKFVANEGTLEATPLELTTMLKSGGLSSEVVEQRRGNCGHNSIHVEVTSLLLELGTSVSQWFFILQTFGLFSSWWFRYYTNAVMWIGMSVHSIVSSVVSVRRNMTEVKRMAESSYHQKVEVLRGNQWMVVASDQLVPGDVICVTDDMELPCDMVLLKGQAAVDESTLTGESIPVQKIALDVSSSLFDITARQPVNADAKSNKKHILFAGTRIITRIGAVADDAVKSLIGSAAEIDVPELPAAEDENPLVRSRMARTKPRGVSPGLVVGVALRTGASTMKGRLLKSILFPSQFRFKISEQMPIVMMLMGVYAIGMVLSQSAMMGFGLISFLYGVGCMSQVLPIWFPTVQSMGLSFSAKRLESECKIYSLAPARILVAGKVRVMCFDKTGTITKDGINFIGVHPTKGDNSGAAFCTPLISDGCSPCKIPPRCFEGMMCCHALSVMPAKSAVPEKPRPRKSMVKPDKSIDSEAPEQSLLGSEMEKRMFHVTGSRIEDILDARGEQISLVHPPSGSQRPPSLAFSHLEVLKVFSFDHARQSMAAVVREVTTLRDSPDVIKGDIIVFVKGSYEKVAKMCTSGMPNDVMEIAESHARQGAYVLGLACKALVDEAGLPLSAERAVQHSRDEIENGLRFEGLLLFRNEVKEESPKAMKLLRDGHVRSVIVTGDNALTAGYVARACGMIRRSTHNPEVPRHERPIILGEMIEGSLTWRNLDTNESAKTFDIFEQPGAFRELAVTQAAFDYLKVATDRTHDRQQGEGEFDETSSCESMPCESDAESTASTASSRSTVRRKKMLSQLLMRIRIFARMTPDGKVDVVQTFMNRGFVVGMCGDGGNDCGALRAAHIGVSMSEAEASVVSSFNAKEMNTTAVPQLLLEGRGALASSLAAYKFLCIYSLIISTVKLVLLSQIANAMSELQWMIIDCAICSLTANAMIRSAPRKELAGRRPTASILGPSTVLSVVLMHAVNLVFLGSIIHLMYSYAGFQNSFEWNKRFPSFAWWSRADNYEAASVFIWGSIQLVNAGFVFTFGGVFRRKVFSNVTLMFLCCGFQAVMLYLAIGGPSALTCLFRTNCDTPTSESLKNWYVALFARVGEGLPFAGELGHNIFPTSWKIVLVGMCVLNASVNILIDRFIINGAPAAYYRKLAESERSEEKDAPP